MIYYNFGSYTSIDQSRRRNFIEKMQAWADRLNMTII